MAGYTYNRMARSYADAWLTADKAQTKSGMVVELERAEDELEELLLDISATQTAAGEQREDIGFLSSVVGCIGGGIVGSVGGPLGAIAGCSAGAGVVSKAVDWAYDGSLIQTDLENKVIDLEKDLDSLEVDLSRRSHKYDSVGAAKAEEVQQTYINVAQKQMDAWRESWYALDDQDYFIGIVGDIAKYALSDIGGDLMGQAWASDYNVVGNLWDDWMYSYAASIPTYTGESLTFATDTAYETWAAAF
mgnify:CR=1 FL=1